MEQTNSKFYKEWEKRNEQEIKFLFSPVGEEIQYCLVAQGYKKILFGRLLVLFGSGFTVINIIKNIENKIHGTNKN